MEKAPNKIHDFIVEKSERVSESIYDLAILLTDVRGGKVKVHLTADAARQLASNLTNAIDGFDK